MSTNPNLFKSGNNAWEKRSKHGRDKIFSEPETLLEDACGYFRWCESHPLFSYEWKSETLGSNMGSKLVKKKIPLTRAYTMIGFSHYLGVSESWFRKFKAELRTSTTLPKEVVSDFFTVIAQIEETIYNQKFSAAAAGLLKENLISRDLGLADKMRSENVNLNGDLTRDEVQKISKLLDDEV